MATKRAAAEPARRRVMAAGRPIRGWVGVAIVLVVAIAVPPSLQVGTQVAITNILYAVLIGISWNIIGGFAGQFALGQMLFVGIGAYGTAWLLNHGVTAFVGLGAGILLSMGVSFLLGQLLFRRQLRDFYFALVTMALVFGAGYTVQNISFLGGPNGLILPVLNGTADLVWATTLPYYYFVLILVVIAIAVSVILYRSAAGWKIRAVVRDEVAAAAAGIDPIRSKVLAFVVSAALASAAGTFYVCQNELVNSETILSLNPLLLMLAGPIIGGLGTMTGPILGGLVVGGVQQITLTLPLTSTTGAVITEAVFGLALVIVPLAAPKGLIGVIDDVRRRLAPPGKRAEADRPQESVI